jgi:hypothetical protein
LTAIIPATLLIRTAHPGRFSLFIKNKQLYRYKLYPALCCMQYILQQINMENDFKPRLKELMKTCPLAQEKEMGFPADWLKEKFWE